MKVAVITGAGTGMGAACVKKFKDAGYEIAMLGRRDIPEKEGCYYYKCDVSKPDEIKKTCDAIKEKFGHVDVLVNNAGVYRGGTVEASSEDDYDYVFDINVKGPFLMMKELIPVMPKGSAIVNVSSSSGIGADYHGTIYGASKAALNGMTKCVAIDYASKGIRVNAIAPSATDSPMFVEGNLQVNIDAFKASIPDHVLGTVEQIANVVYFLASDMSEHVTGQIISIDGGLSAWNGQPNQVSKTT